MQTIKTYITMKRLLLLLTLFGVLATGCEELLPNEQTPNAIPVFSTDGESSYIVDAEGEEIAIMVTTNIDYSVVIPTDAEEWLSVADTRASRVDTLSFIVAPNDTAVERTTTVKFVDDSNNILQTISFTQNAAAQSESVCPNNEIWYTNGSTTEATTPYKTDVFGANIVSNTYDAAKECWIIKFDGDVTTIGEYAFNWCDSLTSVTIPDSVTTIGVGAFAVCNRLTEFKGKFASEDSRCLIVDGILNSFAPAGLTEYTTPNSVTTIGSYAFYGCSSLTSVTIPDSVTTIGDSAFRYCINLTSVTIGDIVTTIGDGAFSVCSSLTSVTIGDSVTTIGDGAFAYCSSLTCVTIPDSVTTIGSWAFENCSSLTSVTIPDSVTTIGGFVFNCCSSLTSVTIGNSVTTIGEWAFVACYSLTSITIPDSVTTIGDGAFADCSSLQEFKGKFASEDGRCLIIDGVLNSFAIGCGATEYTILDSVTSIGNNAFENCSYLTSVTIPDSVTSIGNSAFYWCESLTSVYCKATTPPAGDSSMFYNNALGRKIYVPMESVDAYKSAEGWSDYKSYIVGYNF